jgi:hypothetical protein
MNPTGLPSLQLDASPTGATSAYLRSVRRAGESSAHVARNRKPLNILVIPIGSHGDVHPMVGVAEAMSKRGHRVTVLTNEHFEPLVRRAGLAFESLATDAEVEDGIRQGDRAADRPDV